MFMRYSPAKKKFLAGLVVLSVLFILIRLRFIGHLLMWDEAWNILSLRAFILNAAADPFYWFYYYHPPLYMALGGLLAPFEQGLDIRLEVLSLAFSYGTFLVVYVMSARIGSWRLAWLSGLFSALLPAQLAYDTWIKRDPAAVFFGFLGLLLLYSRKFAWCAVALGLSLLGKENGVFFAAAALVMIPLLKVRRPLVKITYMALIIFALSSWWYLLFSEMTTHGSRFFAGGTSYIAAWGAGPLFYVKKLLPDLGGPGLVLFLFGLYFILNKTFSGKQPRWFFPAAVFFSVYIPISLVFALKPPWLSIPAMPAAAMIIGAGAFYLLRWSRKIKTLYAAVIPLAAGAVLSGFLFSYGGYHMATNPRGWPGALSSRTLAQYLNERMDENDRLMITGFEYWRMPTCPVFLYYWEPHPVKTISSGEKASDVIKEIRAKNISWFVVVGTPEPRPGSKFMKLARGFRDKTGAEPETVAWSYVWNTEKLLKK